MSSLNATGKTIGEVEKLTGIPRRKLKYFIEQKIMQPSQRGETGYWLYSPEDIQKVQVIALYRELNYSDDTIRALINDPSFEWKQELDKQIVNLLHTRDRTEEKILVAELLRYSQRTGAMPGRIDAAVESSRIGAYFMEAGQFPQLKNAAKQILCESFYKLFIEAAGPGGPLHNLKGSTAQDPGAHGVQDAVRRLCEMFAARENLSPNEVLF